MNAALENLSSKKLVANTGVTGVLVAMAIQQPEKAMIFAYMIVGYNAFYSLLELWDKWMERKYPKPVVPEK